MVQKIIRTSPYPDDNKGSNIYRTLLNRQIDNFVNSFDQDGNSLFKNSKNILIHPGEYGMYREECFKRLLQIVLDKEYSISDGFIINSENEVSSQIDVLIHRSNARSLSDGSFAKFFPVEEIAAIVEVKSNLTKATFKEALLKLARNKKLGDARKEVEDRLEDDAFIEFYPIPTFLICNKLQFELDDGFIENIYEGIDRRYWHNCILSLQDGVLHYFMRLDELGEDSKKYCSEIGYNVKNGYSEYQYSQHCLSLKYIEQPEIYNCHICFHPVDTDNCYGHIHTFLASIEQAVGWSVKYSYDFAEYLGIINRSL